MTRFRMMLCRWMNHVRPLTFDDFPWEKREAHSVQLEPRKEWLCERPNAFPNGQRVTGDMHCDKCVEAVRRYVEVHGDADTTFDANGARYRTSLSWMVAWSDHHRPKDVLTNV